MSPPSTSTETTASLEPAAPQVPQTLLYQGPQQILRAAQEVLAGCNPSVGRRVSTTFPFQWLPRSGNWAAACGSQQDSRLTGLHVSAVAPTTHGWQVKKLLILSSCACRVKFGWADLNSSSHIPACSLVCGFSVFMLMLDLSTTTVPRGTQRGSTAAGSGTYKHQNTSCFASGIPSYPGCALHTWELCLTLCKLLSAQSSGS